MPYREAVRQEVRRFELHAAVGYLVLVLVLGVGGYEVNRQGQLDLWRSQLNSCHRGNLLREESNRRLGAHQYEAHALAAFLDAAAVARQRAGTRLDRATAARYRKLARGVRAHVIFRSVPLIDCTQAIPKP